MRNSAQPKPAAEEGPIMVKKKNTPKPKGRKKPGAPASRSKKPKVKKGSGRPKKAKGSPKKARAGPKKAKGSPKKARSGSKKADGNPAPSPPAPSPPAPSPKPRTEAQKKAALKNIKKAQAAGRKLAKERGKKKKPAHPRRVKKARKDQAKAAKKVEKLRAAVKKAQEKGKEKDEQELKRKLLLAIEERDVRTKELYRAETGRYLSPRPGAPPFPTEGKRSNFPAHQKHILGELKVESRKREPNKEFTQDRTDQSEYILAIASGQFQRDEISAETFEDTISIFEDVKTLGDTLLEA